MAEAGGANGDVVTYLIEEGNDFEIGRGTYASAGTALSRTTVLLSKIGGTAGAAKMTLAGAAVVSIVAAAEDITNTGPTIQVFTAGSGTYTTPSGCRHLRVRMCGGGGGGAGSGTGPGSGGAGGTTTFGTLTCNGGTGGAPNTGATAAGGTASGGDINLQGGPGGSGVILSGSFSYGGSGGGNAFGSGPGITTGGGNPGVSGLSKGSGGSGATAAAHTSWGNGGGAGGYLEKIINGPDASYAFSVGAAGAQGAAGTSGQAGGFGAAGIIIVEEFYGN
jgi:hypothetical protein